MASPEVQRRVSQPRPGTRLEQTQQSMADVQREQGAKLDAILAALHGNKPGE